MKDDPRILMIEDAVADAELVERELANGGFSFHFKRVETKDQFEEEMTQHPPDLILSDHGLPSFDGFTALALVRGRYPDLPFIFVAGAMGEEATIQAFEQGATDYVLKNNLYKLVPVVQRALREAENRHIREVVEADRHRLIQDLHQALFNATTLSGLLPICSSCKKVRDDEGSWKTIEVYLREHSNLNLTHGLCPECVERCRSNFNSGGG